MKPYDCWWYDCDEKTELIMLSGCLSQHLSEMRCCNLHMLRWVKTRTTCYCGLPNVERLISDFHGNPPDDPHFYPGEWVTVDQGGKVIGHNYNPMTLVGEMAARASRGHLTYQVPE